MLVDFNSLSDSSRIWLYQSDQKFTEEQVAQLEKDMATFLTSWTAHGASLKAGFEIKYDRFIVIALRSISSRSYGLLHRYPSAIYYLTALQEESRSRLTG